MMNRYQMFFMFNYASSDYYRTLEILSGMMQILKNKLERDVLQISQQTLTPSQQYQVPVPPGS